MRGSCCVSLPCAGSPFSLTQSHNPTALSLSAAASTEPALTHSALIPTQITVSALRDLPAVSICAGELGRSVVWREGAREWEIFQFTRPGLFVFIRNPANLSCSSPGPPYCPHSQRHTDCGPTVKIGDFHSR